MFCVMETNDPDQHAINQLYWKTVLAVSLLSLLTLSISLYAERYSLNKPIRLTVLGFAIIAAGLYFLSLPAELTDASTIRWVVLAIAAHLLVSFSPFLLRNEMNGIWQFNKSLFMHFLIGGVYSGVLFAGLAGALGAISVLFEIHVDSKYYADLWFVIAGTFNTWFFLAGVPREIHSLESVTDYPKSLKIFTVHVLLPLISVYLVILYLYSAKILITQDWPVGWVAYMVIAFSVSGILSFLLIYPLRDDAANAWVKFYSRLFYYALILPIILLYISIFKRINMYGWTEDRYFVVLLALWLTFITVYLITTGGRKIRMIPQSLFVFALLSTFGPWGAFEVSRHSQLSELTALFKKNEMLVNGKVDTAPPREIELKEYKRIKSIVWYLDHMHGYQELQPFFAQNLDSLLVSKKLKDSPHSYFDRVQTYMDVMNLKETLSVDTTDAALYYHVIDNVMYNIPGYDVMTFFGNAKITSYPEIGSLERDSLLKEEFVVGADTLHYTYSKTTQNITLTYKKLEPLVMNTKTMFDALPAFKEDYAPELLMLSAENAQWKARVCFRAMNVTKGHGKTIIRNSEGALLLKFADTVESR
jgi:hypothetical protein